MLELLPSGLTIPSQMPSSLLSRLLLFSTVRTPSRSKLLSSDAIAPFERLADVSQTLKRVWRGLHLALNYSDPARAISCVSQLRKSRSGVFCTSLFQPALAPVERFMASLCSFEKP